MDKQDCLGQTWIGQTEVIGVLRLARAVDMARNSADACICVPVLWVYVYIAWLA